MSSQHAWERDLHQWADVVVGDRESDSGGEDAANYDEVTQEEAATELADLLVDLKFKGVLNATQTCMLCFWCHRAGVKSDLIKKLSVRPDSQSGWFSTHFNRVLGVRSDDIDEPYYEMDVVGYNRGQAVRCSRLVPIWPPLEAIDEEYRRNPGLPARLTAAIDACELPPKYLSHRVVRDNVSGVPVFPIAFYADAVAFMRTDGVLGLWVLNLVSGVRHLCCVLRKSELCTCGCRGWDSIVCVMAALGWSFDAAATGVHPSSRHDRAPWKDSDAGRELVAGTALGFKLCCLFFKNDLMENVTTYGFPSWATLEDPCLLCHCTRGNMYSVRGLSLVSLPWAEKSFAEYKAACASCERWVTMLDDEIYRRVRAALEYDKREQGNRGRCLLVDIPELSLRKGDRLEPHLGMLDVSEFDRMPGPVRVVLFWRRAHETMARRRNPLFSDTSEITPSIFVPDWLHALSLGVYKYFVSQLFHALIDVNAFDCIPRPREVLLRDSVGVIREMLFAWYRREAAEGRPIVEKVQNLTPEMVGDSADHALGTWGHETNGILKFSASLFAQRGARLPQEQRPHYEHGLKTLLAVHTFITTYKKKDPPPAAKQDA